MVFEQRKDAAYFLTMNYQEPDKRGDSHDPYVVLNRLRTLLVTLDALKFCKVCEPKNIVHIEEVMDLHIGLKKQYQEVDQLFLRVNAFAEKVVTHFDLHVQFCETCQATFQEGATTAQAMQDSIYENPETPDTTWLSESQCLQELFSVQDDLQGN